jgi:Ca2+-binding EF-hand superfamily protein
MSPRGRSEEIVGYLATELRKKNLDAMNAYRMAEVKKNGAVRVETLVTCFQKILPFVSAEVLKEAMKAFRGEKEISQDNFRHVFEGSTKNRKDKADFYKSRGNGEQKKMEGSEAAAYIRALDDAMLSEGLSPVVAFKNADINHNGTVTTEELEAALKRLLPAESLSLAEIKGVMKALDANGNGTLEESEFISAFADARKVNVTVINERPHQKNSRHQANLDTKKMEDPTGEDGQPLLHRDIRSIT